MASGHEFTNRLAKERSPYLLQHAHNPVDWYPWGEEAFAKAKKENKLIFLSVGYSTCHWCHVMERESFENPDIGKLMNEHFVNIKVDREERPDVDRVYMTFVQATSGGGGWPMSVWLTPDLKPVVGATYFPPTDKYGRPGFGTILTLLAKQWQEQRDQLNEKGTMILDALMRATQLQSTDTGLPGLDVAGKCFKQLSDSYDSEFGGFGDAPKFPQPVLLSFLLRYHNFYKETSEGKKALEMCLHTMRMMAKGGVYDHVSQGFHRYSTDRVWHVPHFEKMLYDQGQLVSAYITAYQITKDEFFAEVAKEIIQYVCRDLSDESGGFYSAEDADSLPSHDAKDKKEGAFCVWTEKEARELLCDKLEGTDVSLSDVFCRHFNVREGGNVSFEQDPHNELKNQNVLLIQSDIEATARRLKITTEQAEEAIRQSKSVLFEARKKRPKPHLDDKMLASWNGLMISGLSRTAQVLNDSDYLQRAVKAANFVKENLFDVYSGCLLRSSYKGSEGGVEQISQPIGGFIDDYAFIISALLDLYEASYDQSWLEFAVQLQEKQDELFWDAEMAGYFSATGKDDSILLRLKEDQDGAEPSGNSVAALNLVRLARLFNRQDWKEKAEKLLTAFSDRLSKIPMALPEMISGLMFYHKTPQQIIVRGERASEETEALLKCIHAHHLPNKVLLLADGDAESFLYKNVDLLKSLEMKDGKSTGYVCENFECQLPVNSLSQLEELLKK
ncbi:spermatogenesis-associated protein 20-like isoform X2 [Apostichopus japonicus]